MWYTSGCVSHIRLISKRARKFKLLPFCIKKLNSWRTRCRPLLHCIVIYYHISRLWMIRSLFDKCRTLFWDIIFRKCITINIKHISRKYRQHERHGFVGLICYGSGVRHRCQWSIRDSCQLVTAVQSIYWCQQCLFRLGMDEVIVGSSWLSTWCEHRSPTTVPRQ